MKKAILNILNSIRSFLGMYNHLKSDLELQTINIEIKVKKNQLSEKQIERLKKSLISDVQAYISLFEIENVNN